MTRLISPGIRQWNSAASAWLGVGIVFLGALFLYSWTLAPTVTLVDSGELMVAARSLGIAHPPGFPLYIMLAHLASLVPLGNVAVRVNFASALFAALASATITLVIAELMMTASFVAGLRKQERKKGRKISRSAVDLTLNDPDNGRLLVLVPAIGAGLLFSFSRTLWSYATITEVYTLNTFLIVAIFLLMSRWRRRIIQDERRTSAAARSLYPPPITDYDFLLYTAALLFGLALGVHHVTVALVLPALAVLVYRTQGIKFFASKRFVFAALFSIAGLLAVYSYLPIAASRAPLINWGDPRSLQEIWWHITGRQYQVFFSFSPAIIGEQLKEIGKLVFREFGPWWIPPALVCAIAGFSYAFRRDRTIGWFLVLIIIANITYASGYDIAEDKDAYCLPTFISLAIAAAFGMRWLIEFALSKASLAKRALIFAVFLVPAVTLSANWPFNNRSRYFIAHDYVENILKTIEPDGLLLTLDWQVQSPMLYLREVEQRRRDVKVVDIHLLRRSWYFDYLKRAYPGLLARSSDKVDAFLIELKAWEADPAAYLNDVSRTQRIAFTFQNMLQSFVKRELEIGPVYITYDLVFMTEENDQRLTEWLTKTYQLVAQGLVFKLERERGFHDPGDLQLETRGLADGTLKFEEDDVAKIKVFPVYPTMLVNRGRYLALFNQHQRAIKAFEEALALDPNIQLARQGINESRSKLGNSKSLSR